MVCLLLEQSERDARGGGRGGTYLSLMVRILKFLVNETPSVPAAPSKRPVPPVTASTAGSGCRDLRRTTPWTVRLPLFQTAVTTQFASVKSACCWGIWCWGILVSVHTPASWPTIGYPPLTWRVVVS